MTYGIQVFSATGATLWDSSTAGSGVVVDVFSVAAFATDSKTYPDFAGRTAGAVVLSHLGSTVPTVDYSLGHPRITVPSDSEARTVLVAVF